MVISSSKYEVVNVAVSSFENRMSLTVRSLSSEDLGGYRCVVKNSLGEADNVIRLYEIPGPTARNTIAIAKKEDLKYSTAMEGVDNQFGSGDGADDEDDKDPTADTAHRAAHDNATRNRTHYNLLQSVKRNKVNKVMNVADETGERSNGENLRKALRRSAVKCKTTRILNRLHSLWRHTEHIVTLWHTWRRDTYEESVAELPSRPLFAGRSTLTKSESRAADVPDY
ncbi:hypothetical protein EVAR_86781_1 [Eumeta japonica]|uniref:Immunoglobulin I-set domain-containing protein n=1 Tax=Eumeta variegata TaxID=151549 RepID=A0A4C1W364_EUMVA|nr:hypothetical protein EVAR_86781_1 [Eumeta japonica]